AEYRQRPALLADWLPWAGLVAPGVVLNKDGSFQRTFQFRGPDVAISSPCVALSICNPLGLQLSASQYALPERLPCLMRCRVLILSTHATTLPRRAD
ncbi:hypothetical protein LDZ95_25855, partial [Pseudomonas aeruginosa]|nr:hypothetical protein [Pseudomonas aeruginosa]